MGAPLAAAAALATRGLAALAGPRLSILMYHRVHAAADPIFPEEVDAERFERQMAFVAANYRVMTLARAARHLADGDLPRRALVITFDDGYADNVEVALPILVRHRLPACFFITTGFLDGGRMWNDSVIECLRQCRRERVDLGRFDLGEIALRSAGDRRAAVDRLLPKIKYMDLEAREQALAGLLADCGVAELPTTLMMRSAQVRELHAAGMEIGAHTVRHPILAGLDPAAATAEIAEGRERLAAIIDAPVDVFAYPNGRPRRDYDASHVATVRRLGFRAAVSTAHGVSRSGDDLFQLPRFTPWDRDLGRWGTRLLLNQRQLRFDRVEAG